MQTKKQSLVEAVIGTLIAFTLSTVIQPVVLGTYACTINYVASMEIALIFTFISFVRNYIVRRCFNWLHVRGIW